MLASLTVLGGALLVAAGAAPQPYITGSLNATINYIPQDGWGEFIAPGGYEHSQNYTVAVFANKEVNLAAVNWTMPCMFFCLPSRR